MRDILGKTVPEAVEERKDGDGMEEIVTAKEADLPRILEIYDIAKAYMRASGNPNQWNGAYPDPETLRTDMEKQRLYVYKKKRKDPWSIHAFAGRGTDLCLY